MSLVQVFHSIRQMHALTEQKKKVLVFIYDYSIEADLPAEGLNGLKLVRSNFQLT